VVLLQDAVLGVVLMIVWSCFRGSRPFFRAEEVSPPVRSVDGGRA